MSYLVLNRHPTPEAGYLYDVVHACTGESKRDWSYSYACRVAEFENAFRESEPACDFDRCQGYVVFRGRHAWMPLTRDLTHARRDVMP